MGIGIFDNILNNIPQQAPAPKPVDPSMSNFQRTLPSMENNYQPSGKGGGATYSPLSGQPSVGSPNQYSNTVGQWDNSGNQSNRYGGGKGKGY